MLIADLASLGESHSTWAQVYLSCCNTERGDCWKSCAHCCCYDLDFDHLRRALASHVHSLDALSLPADKVRRAFWLIPEVYVAGFHTSHYCFSNVSSWAASKEPSCRIWCDQSACCSVRSVWTPPHTEDTLSSQDADWAAFGLPNYSKLVGKDLLQGQHHVQNHGGDTHCSRDFHDFCHNGYDYVCDVTEPTLHWSKDCGVMYYLSPAAGTGWHTYKYMLGQPPEGCKPGEHCDACSDPPGEV
ncbi:unnamed protein product [Effrenium voratum]|nr:unnamed protein product [Effrenium voratum]